MKNIRLLAFVLAFCPLWAIAAETVTTEEFQSMAAASTLTFSDGYTIGETSFVTYTCSGGNTKFGNASESGNTTCIFVKSGGYFTTTAIPDLKKVKMVLTSNVTNMTFYYSVDNSSWVALAADALLSSSQQPVYVLPSTGRYYLKVAYGGSTFYVRSMQYTTEPSCNCLRLEMQDN